MARGLSAQSVEIVFTYLSWRIIIKSDQPRYLNLFSQLYSRALNDQSRPSQTITFQVWTKNDNPFGFPVLVAGDELYRLGKTPLQSGPLHDLVIGHVQRHLTSHFLIHAGAVSRDDLGILLVGDAFYGKSTLVLELIQRGYRFLSDDTAAIGRADGHIYPSPRGINARPASAGHLDMRLPGKAHETLGNHLFDIEELFPGQMGSAVPIGAVCILGDAAMMPQTPGTSPTHLVHIWVESATPDFLDDLGHLQGTANLVTRCRKDDVHITLTAGDMIGIADRVRALCSRHGVRLLGISTNMGHHPDFSNPPSLTPIPVSQAAIYMMQRFRGGRETLLRTTPGGKPTQLFAELAGLIGGAVCYVLSVGPLRQTADLIDAIPLPSRNA